MFEITGRAVRLSRGRRLVVDFLHFCRPADTLVAERSANVIRVAAVRLAAEPKVGWFPVLLKAYALAGRAVPELRLSRLRWPFPHLHRHSESTALVTVERELDGEPAVFVYPLHHPESKSLLEIQAELTHVRNAPLGEVKAFRRALALLRLPRPVRRAAMWLGLYTRGRWRARYFGTFTASSVAPLGALTQAIGPHTAFFAPAPVALDGATTFRVFFDRRAIDAAKAQAALAAVEAALNGPLLDELRALARPLRAAV